MNNRPICASSVLLTIKDEPPFFLNHSSTETRTEWLPTSPSAAPMSLPLRPGFERFDSRESADEDYRSIIDDLTVENKMLRNKLRRYEKPQDHHLQSDKLFELRMHGLSASKKRELEEILNQFASRLKSPLAPQNKDIASSQMLAPDLITAAKPSFSHTSTRFADSGYGSMAASNRPSSNTTSNHRSTRVNHMPNVSEASKVLDQSIHSYLHDIPEGLLPQQTTVMTEETKKQLVVSRLEQIFGGRGAAAEGPQQPIQQQEVSKLAAKADRSATEAQGERAVAEGTREAPIMNFETEEPMNFVAQAGQVEQHPKMMQGPSCHDKVGEHDFAAPASPCPEQRPTRPLDLDPYRAQIPAENVEYIRHLGFALPEADTRDSRTCDQGWIYLNLLINMAQLHTINVTPEFVKRAVMECSSKFELSPDGRKLRWQGDQDKSLKVPSDTTSGFERSLRTGIGDRREGTQNVRKRTHTQLGDDEFSSGQLRLHPAKKQALSNCSDSKFIYTPLFGDSGPSDEDDVATMYDEQSESSPVAAEDDMGDSSALPNPMQRLLASSKHCDNGLVVFYNNANFYTDLSCDHEKPLKSYNIHDYKPLTVHPLGQRIGTQTTQTPTLQSPLSNPETYSKFLEPPGQEAPTKASGESDLEVYCTKTEEECVASIPRSPPPIGFGASGLGGVYPEDNFAVFVERGIKKGKAHSKIHSPPWSRPLGRTRRPLECDVNEETRSIRVEQLAPSTLPDASFTFSPDTTDSDAEDDLPQGTSEWQSATNSLVVASEYSDSQSDADSIPSMQSENESQPMSSRGQPHTEMDDGDDQSVDFLAVARQVDPEHVAKREREYNAELAERLAEEIPAGSSAATCGGALGSGFNSPDEGGDDESRDPDAFSTSVSS